MNSFLKIAVMLTAYDQMSREIQAAVGKSKKELTDLKNHARSEFAQGMGLVGAGMVGVNGIVATEKAFMDLDQSTKELQSTMQRAGGATKEMQADLTATMNLAKILGNRLPGTTAEITSMFTAMEQNGVTAAEVIGGVGESAANLAVITKKGYTETGIFVAKLKEAAGVDPRQMMEFIDTIARADQLGAKAEEMSYAFARSGGALKLMKLQGLEASKSVSTLFATLIRSGASGETIGTGMTSVFNSITNSDKMKDFNDALQKYGISMDFVDRKTGEFAGIENMIGQFDKIKQLNLGVEEKGLLTRALLGPGQDANFMNLLIDKGVTGFNKMTKEMSDQAKISEKVNIQMSSMKNKVESLDGTFTNLLATLGAALAPTINKVIDLLNIVIGGLITFFELNPKLAKFIMLLVAMGSAFLIIAGAVKILKAVRAAMIAFNIVCAANPYVLIAAAIIAVVAALYIWRVEIKNFLNAGGGLFKWVMILLNPFAALVVYFDEIVAFLMKIPALVKSVGEKILKYIPAFLLPGGPSMTVALAQKVGSVMSETNSMNKLAKKTGILGKIPGPLPKPSNTKINKTNNNSGDKTDINYSPTITIGAGSNKEDFKKVLDEHADDIARIVKNKNAKQERKKY